MCRAGEVPWGRRGWGCKYRGRGSGFQRSCVWAAAEARCVNVSMRKASGHCRKSPRTLMVTWMCLSQGSHPQRGVCDLDIAPLWGKGTSQWSSHFRCGSVISFKSLNLSVVHRTLCRLVKWLSSQPCLYDRWLAQAPREEI